MKHFKTRSMRTRDCRVKPGADWAGLYRQSGRGERGAIRDDLELMMAMKQCVAVFSVLVMLQSIAWGAQEPPVGGKPVVAKQELNEVTLANGIVTLKVDAGKRNITVTDAASGAVMVDNAWVAADGWGGESNKKARQDSFKNWTTTLTVEAVEDAFGKGQRAVLTMTEPKRAALPTYLFSYALYDNTGAVFMGFGIRNQMTREVRLMSAAPMSGAELMPGTTLENLLTLNGAAGAEATHVKRGPERTSPNSLLLTCTAQGGRRSVVWGGLCYQEFGKYASLGAHLDTVGKKRAVTVPRPAETKTCPSCRHMKKASAESQPRPAPKPRPTLAEVEREVVAESREWGRRRLQERLQQLAREEGQFFPPRPAAAPPADLGQ